VEKHVRTQISQLYRNVLQQQCNLEQRVLKNALALATHSPDAFAYHITQEPGYMAILAGEVIHSKMRTSRSKARPSPRIL